ncbi:type IV pilin protein [Ferrimonas balearica]|uniref:type IV pilin protein n=1 Tax=Ferrimonas balearica TaxID=44012 RepID=UPI001C99F44A|nr:type IV pilin protein [Ferrimonas balearica]MBY5993431.1 prepilin-type N-terminal cleavage/methylation domain-containing protein [Ferrimonas balearica]
MAPTALRLRGFTLIEMMIVVAIAAVLAAIAVPSFQSHLREARRAEALESLIQMQLAQEEHWLEARSYTATTSDLTGKSLNYYTLSVTTSGGGYTLTATAKSGTSQASDTEGSTSCATLSLSHADVRSPSACW